MDYYTNEDSLAAAFGVDEAIGLLGDDPDVRLARAASSAYATINAYLKSGGYVVPVVFQPFGKTPTADLPALDGRLQEISDVLTAASLGAGTDLQKKPYIDGKADGIAWLEKVRTAEIRLDLPKTTTPTGSGEAVAVARPSVFNKSLRRESDIFGKL